MGQLCQYRSTRYYVCHRAPGTFGYDASHSFEIHILRRHGKTRHKGCVGSMETELRLGDSHTVPTAVLEAARRLNEGEDAYVDRDGRVIPWDELLDGSPLHDKR